jgi:hypothetical protein
MVANRIDAKLTKENQEAVLDALAEIRRQLPFLLELPPAEKNKLPKLGKKSRDFVEEALQLAEETPDLIPEDFDLDDLERDLALYDKLQPVIFAVMQLQDLLLGTATAAGSDAYSAALAIYEKAKAADKGEALTEILEEMREETAQ